MHCARPACVNLGKAISLIIAMSIREVLGQLEVAIGRRPRATEDMASIRNSADFECVVGRYEIKVRDQVGIDHMLLRFAPFESTIHANEECRFRLGNRAFQVRLVALSNRALNFW